MDLKGMKMQPALSFIIPTYGRAATLRDTIECALAQRYHDFEVIVATQDLKPPAFLDEMVRQHPDRLRVLHLPHPNVNAARNAAIRAARGGIMLSVDDDVLFGTDYGERHAARYADPSVGFVTSLTRSRTDETADQALCANAGLLGLKSIPTLGEFVPVDWAPTCAASYRREAVERAGWFDPYFTGGVGDDTDLAVRIRAAGYVGYLDTTIPITHLAVLKGGFATRDPERSDAKRLNDQRMHLYFASKNRRILGWGITRSLFAVGFWATVGICRKRYGRIGIFVAPWTFLGLAARAVRDARRCH